MRVRQAQLDQLVGGLALEHEPRVAHAVHDVPARHVRDPVAHAAPDPQRAPQGVRNPGVHASVSIVRRIMKTLSTATSTFGVQIPSQMGTQPFSAVSSPTLKRHQ